MTMLHIHCLEKNTEAENRHYYLTLVIDLDNLYEQVIAVDKV